MNTIQITEVAIEDLQSALCCCYGGGFDGGEF